MNEVSKYEAGKYDKECTELTFRLGSDITCLVVCGGVKGSGFSVGINGEYLAEAIVVLPRVLRDVANQIEAQLTGGARA
jgi:predicted Na+-dependent transporter